MLSKISDVNPVACVRALRQGWNELLDDYFSRRLTAGKGIRLNRTAAGTVVSTIAGGGGGVSEPGGAAYANYFTVEATENGVRIFDGGNPESLYAGLTDVDTVSAGTLTGPFANGTYICLRLAVQTGTSGNYYTHIFEAKGVLPDPWEPVVILAQIVNGNVIQRWTGGMIFWRSRFVIGFGSGR